MAVQLDIGFQTFLRDLRLNFSPQVCLVLPVAFSQQKVTMKKEHADVAGAWLATEAFDISLGLKLGKL